MDAFIETITKFSDIEADAISEFTSLLKHKSYRKGDYLLKADETCKQLYFLQSGLIKLFFDTTDKKFIMTFFRENSFFTELSSFNTGNPSKYMLAAAEPSNVYCIDKTDVEMLCDKYHSIERFLNKLNGFATAQMMNRISEMLEDDGKRRYNNFITNNSNLLKRISLGDLSDYLGITQVSLSRIRAMK